VHQNSKSGAEVGSEGKYQYNPRTSISAFHPTLRTPHSKLKTQKTLTTPKAQRGFFINVNTLFKATTYPKVSTLNAASGEISGQ